MDIVDKIAMERTGKPASTCIRRWIETGLQQGRQEGLQQGEQKGSLKRINQFIYNRKIRGVSDMDIKYELIHIFELSEEEASKILFEP